MIKENVFQSRISLCISPVHVLFKYFQIMFFEILVSKRGEDVRNRACVSKYGEWGEK